MYHIFICSPVNGHLGCFYILANANGAAMNTEVHVSFRIRVFYKYMPRSAYICPGIAGSYGHSLFFKKTPYFFPQWLYWFAAPTTAQFNNRRRELELLDIFLGWGEGVGLPQEIPFTLPSLTSPWGARGAPSDEGQSEAVCEYVRGSLSGP